MINVIRDKAADTGEKLMLLQDPPPSLGDGVAVPFSEIAADYLSNAPGSMRIFNVNPYKGIRGKIFCDIGGAIIQGHRPSQKAVGDLFSPIVRTRMILNRQAISMRGQHIPFVIDWFEATPK